MLRRSVVAGGMVLALIASAALAQPPKGPGGPGGPRFGGMMPFGGPGGMPASRLMLLGIPEVQKELKLDEQQQDQVKELMGESRKQMQAAFAGVDFQKIRDMSEEERTKLFAEARKKTEAATKELDAKVAKLLDAGQLERLEQLQLQREGVAAFNRPEIAKKLGLSEEQQAKIRKIQEEARRAAGGFPGRDATDEERQEFFAQMRKRGEKVQADLLAVLTDQQQQKWTEMKGKEFKFPQPQFGPGGPGGFGPGGKGGERRRPPAKEQ